MATFIRSPDDAKIKNKMLFASSHDALNQRLDGIAFNLRKFMRQTQAQRSATHPVRRLFLFRRRRCCLVYL
ncbi:hypothetical protein JVT61DRAFT_14524 [Boletus reticuloceps]|uniref:ADF-H domain-containing protein n=1 Tax=Boletus reticuloceps TaxID=495285 RepID=A0A8I3ACR4_9AGAM|nr:hypothetical protein JVT61DRAFT_14524 [Boletus reticuloceps]